MVIIQNLCDGLGYEIYSEMCNFKCTDFCLSHRSYIFITEFAKLILKALKDAASCSPKPFPELPPFVLT